MFGDYRQHNLVTGLQHCKSMSHPLVHSGCSFQNYTSYSNMAKPGLDVTSPFVAVMIHVNDSACENMSTR